MQPGRYFAAQTGAAAERERLASLEQVLDPRSTRQLASLGVCAGWSCLDVGAGGGSIARWLADRVAPDGRVLAVDIDTRFLDAVEHPNLEVRRADILNDELDVEHCDLAHCRFLLMHLARPEQAIERLLSTLKSGGWLMIEEPDFTSYAAADPTHPMSAGFTRTVQTVFGRATSRGLFDACFGRRVRQLLDRAGCVDIHHEGTVQLWRGGEAEAREHQLSLPALVRAGVCLEQEAIEMEAALVDPEFTFTGHTVFAAWGRRPQ